MYIVIWIYIIHLEWLYLSMSYFTELPENASGSLITTIHVSSKGTSTGWRIVSPRGESNPTIQIRPFGDVPARCLHFAGSKFRRQTRINTQDRTGLRSQPTEAWTLRVKS